MHPQCTHIHQTEVVTTMSGSLQAGSTQTEALATVQPVLSKYQRDNKNVKCLLKAGAFQCSCLFQEMNTCLLNTGCLLNRGGH